jgi:hypothetical protein
MLAPRAGAYGLIKSVDLPVISASRILAIMNLKAFARVALIAGLPHPLSAAMFSADDRR